MNKQIYNQFFALCLLACVFLSSCDKDNSLDKPDNKNKNKDVAGVNKWIHEKMKDNYYWSEELPKLESSDGTAEPKTFFTSLLSKKDGKTRDDGSHYYYSYIEEDVSTKSNTKTTNGLNPIYYILDNSSDIYVRTQYITYGSPAEEAGIKRGIWISHYNGKKITRDNLKDFDSYTGSMVLTVGKIENRRFVIEGEITIPAARPIDESPIYVDTTYLINNKKIAYLMYNNFVSGPQDYNDKTYDDRLRAVFTEFSAQKPEVFILDLRYNRGGLISCAQLLATMLVKKSALDKPFCTLKFKDPNKDFEYKFDMNLIRSGTNLDIQSLYVITSGQTASASELIINGLRPYMDVTLVGEVTEGKNVGSNTFSGNPDYTWNLHPITCKVENSAGFSDYSNGFTPNFQVKDDYELALGSTDEFMLRSTLSVIKTGVLPAETKSADGEVMKTFLLPQDSPRAIIID